MEVNTITVGMHLKDGVLEVDNSHLVYPLLKEVVLKSISLEIYGEQGVEERLYTVSCDILSGGETLGLVKNDGKIYYPNTRHQVRISEDDSREKVKFEVNDAFYYNPVGSGKLIMQLETHHKSLG